MDPISIAMGLASIAPSIVRWLAGDKAGQVADQVLGVARGLTSKDDPQEAISALLSNPDTARKFIETWKDIELGLYEAETRRLSEVNQTVRAEIASNDIFVRRARSSFLWAMSATWTVQGISLAAAFTWATFWRPEFAAEILSGLKELMGALAEHWLYALAVTGVAVWSRTQDKQTAQGMPGVFARLAKSLGR